MTDDEIRARFNRLDIDDSGTITKQEIRTSLRGYATDEEVERRLARMDLNDDGSISWLEFERHMHAWAALDDTNSVEAPSIPSPGQRADEVWQSRPDLAARLLARFRQIDTDGSGHLSEEELTSAMRADNMHFTDHAMEVLFAQMDRSDDGRISYAEYLCGLVDGVAPEPDANREDEERH